MSNPGNSGHKGKYKLSRVTEVKLQGEAVLICLDCGHSYLATPMWVSIDKFLEILQARIGKRERCNACQKGTNQ